MLCSLTGESKKEIDRKNVRLIENVKQPSEAGMICTIDSDIFLLTKYTWIGDSGASCHITNNDTG